jgi:CheY-like chemotaxis protein
MTRSIHVLQLEDNPRDAEIIRDRLDVAAVSCDIVLTNSKASFEAALTREPFDLIISDYNLPDYDGVAALKQAQAEQPDVPVIVISGTVVQEEAVRRAPSAEKRCWTKPRGWAVATLWGLYGWASVTRRDSRPRRASVKTVRPRMIHTGSGTGRSRPRVR